MPKKKPGSRFRRKAITIPDVYNEARINRLLQVAGAASFSELVRRGFDELERRHGLPAMPAVLDTMKKDKAGK